MARYAGLRETNATVAYVMRAVVDQAKLARAVEKARRALAPDVVRIRFDLGNDWTGDPSIFFKIVLSDEASDESKLREITNNIERRILTGTNPDELGLNWYFNFRSLSEQNEMQDEAWK